MRPIDADYVKSKLNKSALGGHLYYYVCGVIDDAPTIEAEPVKHAHWEEKQDMNGDTYYQCTNCKEDFVLVEGTPKDNLYYYCPNCGAIMNGGENE